MKNTNTSERPMLNGGTYQQSEFQFYEVVEWKIDAPDCTEAGKLILEDLVRKSIDSYTIWQGDEDLSFFYVCLESEDEEGEYDAVNLEDFGIHVFTFADLSQESRIHAAEYYAEEKRQEGRAYTFQHAYRKLLKEKTHLFDFNGRPAWNSWAGKIDGEERHYV